MQNPGQIWILYKSGQIYLTRTKHDPDDPTWFQPWSSGMYCILTQIKTDPVQPNQNQVESTAKTIADLKLSSKG